MVLHAFSSPHQRDWGRDSGREDCRSMAAPVAGGPTSAHSRSRAVVGQR
jgi:hypothetical protein